MDSPAPSTDASAGALLRVRRLHLHTQREPVVIMRTDCSVCRSEGLAPRSQVLLRTNGRQITAVLFQGADDFLDQDEIGLSEAAWELLGALEGDWGRISHAPPVHSLGAVRSRIFGTTVLTGSEAGGIETRRFPDGETYVRIHDVATEDAFLVCTLAHPDEQFLPLLFAARTIRECGAKKVTLIAPYVAYLRQDSQFHAGEAVSSRIFADLINREFDGLITVDPHLHRYVSLTEIYSIPTRAVHLAEDIGAWVRDHVTSPVVIGPDGESSQWVEEVARYAGCQWGVFSKQRLGDRKVSLAPPDLKPFRDCTPVLIDDIVSSGTTMIRAAKALLGAGLRPGFCVTVHALFGEEVASELVSLFQRVMASDSIANRFSEFRVAPAIAKQLS